MLLGEPGIGKSTVLADARTLAEAEGRHPVLIDLAEYGSEERLLRRLTGRDILEAGAADPPTDLLIDSLDQGLLAIPKLASVLAEAFRQYPVTPNLRVRLTCRSAVWPSTLEDALKAHWEPPKGLSEPQAPPIGIFELAPLTKRDVADAARAEDLDPDAFLAEIEARGAEALASRPVTLRFLIRLAKGRHPFPPSRAALYRDGCELLAAESSRARNAARTTGNRTPSQRLIIAARIAAVLMLTNRESVWIGPHADLDPRRDCSLNDLVGRALMPDGSAMEISQGDLRESLDTGLFWLRGTDRLHFSRQTYAELLAAWYLQQQRLLGDSRN